MYGVIAIFDEMTEKMIKQIWCDLKEAGISSYAYEVEKSNSPYHASQL